MLPRARQHPREGVRQAEPTLPQVLDHVVEALRIAAAQSHQRAGVGWHVRHRRAIGLAPPRLHAIAENSVDLAVMRQRPERLRESPLRKGVGAESLVEHGERRLEPGLGEIRIEAWQIYRR